MQSIRVMVVAQCAEIMDMLCGAIGRDPALQLAGRCPDCAAALALSAQARPDVIAVDGLPGDEWALADLQAATGAAVVALGTYTSLALPVLRGGVADFLNVPAGGSINDWRAFAAEAVERIKVAFAARLARGVADVPTGRPALIAVGGGEGGPVPLACLLKALPVEAPPVLIHQAHMEAFNADFGRVLSEMSGRDVTVGQDGMKLTMGSVTLLPAGVCPAVEAVGGDIILHLSGLTSDLRLTDALFRQAAKALGGRAICVLLAGNGAGEEGLIEAAVAGAKVLRRNKNALLNDIGHATPDGVPELSMEDIPPELLKRMG